jgi:hypothetical protein
MQIPENVRLPVTECLTHLETESLRPCAAILKELASALLIHPSRQLVISIMCPSVSRIRGSSRQAMDSIGRAISRTERQSETGSRPLSVHRFGHDGIGS